MNGRLSIAGAVVFALSMGATGCASSSEPDESLAATESGVETATAEDGDMSQTGDTPAEMNVTASGPTCSPQRAVGAVNAFQKALHDSIAFAEGTEGRGGKDGYNVGFAYKLFASCATHPNRNTCAGGYCSTASGRYQFLTRTWNGTKGAIGAATFEPENQERGAQHLVLKVRKAFVPNNRAMNATEFTNAMNKLSYEWASLPPGRYGQPVKTHAQMRADYCRNVRC